MLGLNPDDARALLQGVPFGFNSTPVIELQDTLDPRQAGIVLEQIPVPDAEVDREVVIVLQVGQLVEPTATPVPIATREPTPAPRPTEVPTVPPAPDPTPVPTTPPPSTTCIQADGTEVIDDPRTPDTCP